MEKRFTNGDILLVSNYHKEYGVVKWNENLAGFYIYKAPSRTLKYASSYEVVRKYL